MQHHTRHYIRAALLLAGGLLLLLVIRGVMIPRSFGEFGSYRGDNVAEQMARPLAFAAKEACATCHEGIWEQHQGGKHATVQCQNCHDALPVHVDVERGEFAGPMPIQRSAQLCLRCHLALPSRPEAHPQIDVAEHLKDVPEAHNPAVCFACHAPHDPINEVKKP